ncbi:Os01g0220500 [Oryza sativa Japonica Group]|uniref:Os01g0220500 protein n=1 Tax=Oryza sativa subsp. japonica TaxID=39947 RepID=A0A0P0V090_ORYSJ|nr:hypothetical protein EE612_001106 [Oryza sativa]BAS71069.1 Os01g0220500 [Oryza sativa Japonica Group]
MAKPQQEVYFVFMNFDPVYERLRADRSVQGGVGHAGRLPEPQARQAPRQAPAAGHLPEEVVSRHRRRLRRRDNRCSGEHTEVGEGSEGGGEEPGACLIDMTGQIDRDYYTYI